MTLSIVPRARAVGEGRQVQGAVKATLGSAAGAPCLEWSAGMLEMERGVRKRTLDPECKARQRLEPVCALVILDKLEDISRRGYR